MTDFIRCEENCSHYDSLNRCCWLVTEKGSMIHVAEGDYCHHGIKEDPIIPEGDSFYSEYCREFQGADPE